MAFQRLSREELAENQRWEERYGEPLKTDHEVNSEFVRIGDEFFSVKDLQESHRKNPQPKSHPFKPHHYCLQKDLDEITAFYKLHPDRKPQTGKAVPK